MVIVSGVDLNIKKVGKISNLICKKHCYTLSINKLKSVIIWKPFLFSVERYLGILEATYKYQNAHRPNSALGN